MGERPARLVLIAGTGTEVGKTWVAAQVIGLVRAEGGMRVAARKPAQSYAPEDSVTDAGILAAATGEQPEDVCPLDRWYAVPMAPFMAAEVLGRPPFTLPDLLAGIRWPAPRVALGVVESAGGVRSPIATDGADTVDLADALRPDLVVVVADAGLGTINAVRLAVGALDAHPVMILLNRFDAGLDLHRRNRAWLAAHLRHPVLVDLHDLSRAAMG